MDTLKYQTEILKGLYKEKINGLYIYTMNDDIYISPNGYSLCRIPLDKFFLDVSNYNEIEILKDHIIKGNEGKRAIRVTRFEKPDNKVKGGIGQALALYGENDHVVYVDYSLIKPFEDKKSHLEFTINGITEAVGVWDSGEFIGIVLPFRYNKDGVNPMQNEREYYE